MNGGIHDAVNLCAGLVEHWHDRAPDAVLDRYDRQRRGVTLEYVQAQTIQNKNDLDAQSGAERKAFRDRMRMTAADPALRRDYLLRAAMFASLERAAALG